MTKPVKVELILRGEAAFFIKMALSETEMEVDELFSKMIDLYKQVYLDDRELGWIEGDVVKKKVNSDPLRKSTRKK